MKLILRVNGNELWPCVINVGAGMDGHGVINVALTFWSDGDCFGREARTSNGRGIGKLGWSDAGVVVKCELMDDEPLKRMRHVFTTRRPCNRSCRQLAFDDHH